MAEEIAWQSEPRNVIFEIPAKRLYEALPINPATQEKYEHITGFNMRVEGVIIQGGEDFVRFVIQSREYVPGEPYPMMLFRGVMRVSEFRKLCAWGMFDLPPDDVPRVQP